MIGLSFERGSCLLEQEEEAQDEEEEFEEGDKGDEGDEGNEELSFSHHLHHPNPIPMAILILVGPLPQAKHLMVLLFSSHLPPPVRCCRP